ncbi:MAG: ion transporter [candidate division NC10 bacterium]|nr:ion transporter [candidate division NC10 bacterium]
MNNPRRHSKPGVLLVLDQIVTLLAVFMIPVLLIEEISATPGLLRAAEVANWVIWLGFVAEFGAKLLLLPDRGTTVRKSWLEVMIIALTPPFVGQLEQLGPLRLLRTLRLLRFLRLMQLALVGLQTLRGLRQLLTRHHFLHVAGAMTLIVLLGGVALFLFEGETGAVRNLGDALWWAAVTVTTVGYGDIVPKTETGRLIGLVVMLVGISFVSVLTANIASYFVEARQESTETTLHQELVEVKARLDELNRLLHHQTELLERLSKGTPV